MAQPLSAGKSATELSTIRPKSRLTDYLLLVKWNHTNAACWSNEFNRRFQRSPCSFPTRGGCSATRRGGRSPAGSLFPRVWRRGAAGPVQTHGGACSTFYEHRFFDFFVGVPLVWKFCSGLSFRQTRGATEPEGTKQQRENLRLCAVVDLISCTTVRECLCWQPPRCIICGELKRCDGRD